MGGGKGDAPDPPDYGPLAKASEKAAEYGYKTSQEQLAWAKERYNLDRELADTLIGSMEERSALQDKWAQEDRQRYQDVFRPIEDQMVREAQEYDTPERRAAEQQRAMASITNQAAQTRRAAQRQLEGYGVNPGDTRYGMDRGSNIALAAAQVGAGDAASRAVEATGQAMKANAANLGRGFQMNPGATQQLALANQQAAGGLNLGTTASGQAGMGTPTQWMGVNQGAISNWGNILNMGYNNQLAQWQANQNAAGSGIGSALGLIGSVGTFFAAEGGEMPEAPARAALPIGNVARTAARPIATAQAPRAPAGAIPAGASPGAASPYRGGNVPAAAATAVGNDPNSPKDTVHAMVKPGEYVLPKHVTDYYGQKGINEMIAKAEKGMQKGQQPTYAEMQPGQIPPVTFMSQGIPA